MWLSAICAMRSASQVCQLWQARHGLDSHCSLLQQQNESGKASLKHLPRKSGREQRKNAPGTGKSISASLDKVRN